MLLVTGRRLDDLQQVCPDLSVFDGIVAENGAVYLRPPETQPRLLAPSPPPEFFERLRARGVTPLDRGAVIVATTQPHEVEVVDAIRALGLELQIIFNKGAVMVLPSGVNKATGLELALEDLGLSRHEVVGVGDGENDHAFLAHCELGVAVADAIPSLADAADVVTRGGAGAGVVELVEALLADDARMLTPRRPRHQIRLGLRADATPFTIPPRDGTLLCVGVNDSARSALLGQLLTPLAAAGYQACLIDPTGVHGEPRDGREHALVLGAADRAPALPEIAAALGAPRRQVIANLSASPPGDHPRFVSQLMARLAELRDQTGRPQFILIDRADGVLLEGPDTGALPSGLILATGAPDRLPPRLRASVSVVLAAGEQSAAAIDGAATALSRAAPRAREVTLAEGEALVWPVAPAAAPFPIRLGADTGSPAAT